MNESKVEVTGFEARHYDTLLNVLSLGSYIPFIKNAISKIDLQPNDRILDLGCGTGRNSCLMAKYLGENGSIVGLDIGKEMIEQFEKKFENYPNVEIQNLRIDEPLPFEDEFDKALLSFVFHGFPNDKKEIIVRNVKKALKPGGALYILDYNEFDLEKKPYIFRKAFKKIECPLAQDYLKVTWKEKLIGWGFENFDEHYFYRRIMRLLKAENGNRK
ncbi:class I SAM-dependent methyltransferase [candidate division KSB1 bacterium]|nr:class I SAM-dependent methyltransferase [candidate division KSB1 bacterium]MBL7093393.1 class I SAM-dependent methyltransferase [candidate division KSB1 bacterium]